MSKRENLEYITRFQILLRYQGRCAVCGWQVSVDGLIFDENGNYQKHIEMAGNEIHHIKSVKDGGGNEIENLILLCPNHHAMAHRIKWFNNLLPAFQKTEQEESFRMVAMSKMAADGFEKYGGGLND